MTVVYYTSAYFLDAAVETIQSIKNMVDLHIIIELSPESKKCTIIDIDDLSDLNPIESCEQVLGKEKWMRLQTYFKGVANVLFSVHKHKRSLSYNSLSVSAAAGKYIKHIKADVVHFDTATVRSIGLYPYIKSRKIFITIHDAVPHSGEASWKDKLPSFVFFKLAKGYFFYSDFVCQQFKKHYSSLTGLKIVIRFQPFTYIAQYLKKEKVDVDAVLFFGRLSPYKGIDMLLKAIPKVLEKYPDEKFIIAGGLSAGYQIDYDIINQYKNNIQLIDRYLSIEELIEFIESAKFVICPYKDASQSGVLMTAFAAGKIVIATNVGAFPEYIKENVNGLLTEPDATAIAHKILEALENEKYKKMEKELVSYFSEEVSCNNQKSILSAYQSV